MGIKFCHDMTTPSLQVNCPSLPQDSVFTASSSFQLQKRERSSIQEDTTFTRHWLALLPVRLLQLFDPLGPHHCWLVIHPSPLVHSQQLGFFLLKHHTSHWMTGKTKKGWLMLLHSQILISRWFVVPSSLVCRDGRGARSSVCARSQTRN